MSDVYTPNRPEWHGLPSEEQQRERFRIEREASDANFPTEHRASVSDARGPVHEGISDSASASA